MNARLKKLRDYIVNHEHFTYRQSDDAYNSIDISEYRDNSLPMQIRVAKRLECALKNEVPVILPDEKMVFIRTLKDLPMVISEEEIAEIKKTAHLHERGVVTNIAPNYNNYIDKGLLAILKDAESKSKNSIGEEKIFYDALIISLNAIIDLADRYKNEALKLGLNDIAKDLEVVPMHPPKNFRQALQFLRIVHYAIWAEGEYHVILGRFDQDFYKYLKNDLDNGVIDKDEALEIVEEFFINCNKDTDLYSGIQQGDNGQSIVLGGVDKEGNDAYNLLSELSLKASLELKTIDPKINLRVDKNTPRERYEFASKLTAVGLGFPQYSNDDVVIPGLLELGYDLEDARNYCVAACWEFIVPAKGMEVVNIGLLSFVENVNKCIKEKGADCKNIDELVDACCEYVQNDAVRLTKEYNEIYLVPAPFMSLGFDGCFENGRDISLGNKYNNYGFHGAGIGNAVDAISAYSHFVYDTKEYTAEFLNEVIKNNFVGQEIIRNKLVNYTEKLGNGIAKVDHIATRLLGAYADALKGIKNVRGGGYRAGTGTAPAYVTNLPAGADGRRDCENLATNYTPSIIIKTKGPFSVIKSMTAPDLKKVINGGPLTLEFSANSIKSSDGVDKLARLAETFINAGGHQLQLNVIDKASLIDAQLHPENYKNLIVRVWGWSGYFVELDKCYQDQIIRRADYSL